MNQYTSRLRYQSMFPLINIFHFSIQIPFLDGLGLVISVLTLGKSNGYLYQSFVIGVKIDRYNGVSFGLHTLMEFPQFPFLKKKFPIPLGVIVLIRETRVLVRGYMKILHIEFISNKGTVSVRHTDITIPDGFDLTTNKDNTSSVFLFKEILKLCLTVVNEYV